MEISWANLTTAAQRLMSAQRGGGLVHEIPAQNHQEQPPNFREMIFIIWAMVVWVAGIDVIIVVESDLSQAEVSD